MSVTEIVLLIVGVLFFAISFFLPDGKTEEKDNRDDEARIKEMVERQVAGAKERIEDMVDETVNYSIEKTERALERLSNEKIMAVDEYSETVLKKINDNHNEAVFLYDMLNDKDEKLKNSTDELNNRTEELKKRDEMLQAMEEERKKKAQEEEEEKRRQKLEEERVRKLKEQIAQMEKEKAEREAFNPLNPERIIIKEEDNIVTPVEENANASVASGEPVMIQNAEENEALNLITALPVSETKAAPKKASKSKPVKVKASAPVDDDDDEMYVSFKKGEENKKNRNEEIKRLHEEGKSNMAIAKELGLGIGEVKLVIDLFSSRK